MNALTDPQAARSHDPSINAMLHAIELLELFYTISDEQKRCECIESVRKIAFEA